MLVNKIEGYFLAYVASALQLTIVQSCNHFVNNLPSCFSTSKIFTLNADCIIYLSILRIVQNSWMQDISMSISIVSELTENEKHLEAQHHRHLCLKCPIIDLKSQQIQSHNFGDLILFFEDIPAILVSKTFVKCQQVAFLSKAAATLLSFQQKHAIYCQFAEQHDSIA